MKTKSTILKSITIIIAAISITACQKYEDGPMFSLRTKTERVSNTWKVDNYKLNDNDYTSLFAGYTETYTKDGDFSFNWEIFGGTGSWAFQNNAAEIKLTGIDNVSSQTLTILKLEEKQFWYSYMDGNDTKVFHMIEN